MAEDVIRAQRGKVYGDPQEMHGNIARVWTAQLRARYGPGAPELDANIAELMLAGFKVLRASRPIPEDPQAFLGYIDSYPDAKNYLDFGREFCERLTAAGLDSQHVFKDGVHDPAACAKCREDVGR